MNDSSDMPPYKDYNAYVGKIISLGIPSNRIYKNWGADESNELQTMFNFFQGYLESGMSFSSSNTYFFYSTDLGISGAAITMQGNNFIKLNIDVFEKLDELFTKNEKLDKLDIIQIIIELDEHTAVPIKMMMRDVCINFTYYHELAHCLQEDMLLKDGISNEPDGSVFSRHRHVLEFDADIFCTLAISSSLFQYFDKYYYRKTKEDLEEFISILLAAIMIRIYLSPNTTVDFYTEENSHPHWVVRIHKITEVFLIYTQHVVKMKYSEIIIDVTKIFSKADQCAKQVAAEIIPNFDRSEIELLIRTNWDSIIEYSNQLYADVNILPNSAFKKWNASSSL